MSDEDSNSTKPIGPIKLISEKFQMMNEGINFLLSLKDKIISIITIVGPRLSGKSTLANELIKESSLEQAEGFEINKSKSSTENKGIYIWGKPIEINGSYLLIIDVNGLTTDQSDTVQIEYAKKVFSLCLLISSNVIYLTNILNNDDNESNIEKSFELFEKYSENISKIKMEDDEYISNNPHCGVDSNNNYITKKDLAKIIWINNSFEGEGTETNKDLSEDEINKSMENLFKLVSNDCDAYNKYFKNKIQFINIIYNYNNYTNITDCDTDSAIVDIKNLIFDQVPPLNISNTYIDGNVFYGILQELLTPLLVNNYPIINSSLRSALFASLSEITEKVTDAFRDKFSEKTEEMLSEQNIFSYTNIDLDTDLDIDDVNIKTIDTEIVKEMLDLLENDKEIMSKYKETFIGKILKTEYLIDELVSVFSCMKEEIIRVLETNTRNYIEKIKDIVNSNNEKKNEVINKFNDDNEFKENFNSFINNIDYLVNETELFNCRQYSFLFLIKDYLNKYVIYKLRDYYHIISESFTSTSNQLEKKIKEKESEIENWKIKYKEIVNENENLKSENRILKNKERLNENNVQIQINKYKNELINKENLIENMGLQLEKFRNDLFDKDINKSLIDSGGDSTNLIKKLYDNISKIYINYSDSITKLEINKKLFFKKEFIDQTYLLIDNENKKINDEIKNNLDNLKQSFSTYQKQIEDLKNENLNLTNQILELQNKINDLNELNVKINNEVLKNNRLLNIIDIQKNTINNQNIYVKKLTSIKNDLENQHNIDSFNIQRYKADIDDYIFSCLDYYINYKKDKFNQKDLDSFNDNLQSISEEFRDRYKNLFNLLNTKLNGK